MATSPMKEIKVKNHGSIRHRKQQLIFGTVAINGYLAGILAKMTQPTHRWSLIRSKCGQFERVI